MSIRCRLNRHDWNTGEVITEHAALYSRWRGCNRCGKQQVWDRIGYWRDK